MVPTDAELIFWIVAGIAGLIFLSVLLLSAKADECNWVSDDWNGGKGGGNK